MASLAPFPQDTQLSDALDSIPNDTLTRTTTDLPDFPCLPLNDSELLVHLQREMYHHHLDQISPRLWMMSKQSSSNISPLHRQIVKGRQICLTEEPKLHLTWSEHRIFVKPLPEAFLCYPLWTHVLNPDEYPHDQQSRVLRIKHWSLGFLRTYAYLIRHESDLDLAKQHRLLPKDTTWFSWRKFSTPLLSTILDTDVSERYHYGEIRLGRLIFYSQLFGMGTYARIHREYGAYFAQFYAPLLFVLGIVSVLLSAMQVELAVAQVTDGEDPIGPGFWWFSRWSSVVVLVGACIIGVLLTIVLVWKVAKEWIYAVGDRRGRKRRERGLVAKPLQA